MTGAERAVRRPAAQAREVERAFTSAHLGCLAPKVNRVHFHGELRDFNGGVSRPSSPWGGTER